MGDSDNGARVFMEETLQPGNALCVQVVGGLVQQQHVGLGQQQFAQCDAAFFTTGQFAHVGVPGRQAQRVGRDFQCAFQVVPVTGL